MFKQLLLLLAFSATLHAACGGYSGTGNWVISAGDDCANVSEVIYLAGNLTVDGSLNLTNVTLILNTTYNGSNVVTVGATGALKLNDSDGDASTTNDASNVTTNNSVYRAKFESFGELTVTHSLLNYLGFSNNNNTINNFGLAIIDANFSNITFNRFSNVFTGVFPGTDGSQISFTNISYNNFTAVDSAAIRLQNATGNTIEGNRVTGVNGFAAIYVSYYSNSNNVTSNTVYDNAGDGIRVYLSLNNTLLANNASNNSNYGISIQSCNYTTALNNSVTVTAYTSVAYYGVYVNLGRYNELNNNSVTKASERAGINVDPSALMTDLQTHRVYVNNTVNGKAVVFYGLANAACPDDGTVILHANKSSLGLLGCDNVTIANGSLYNGDSITLVYTNNTRVINATVNESYAGVFSRYCQNNSLRDSVFYNNSYGVFDESHPSSNYTLQNNSILNISQVGVYLLSIISGGGVTAFNNTLRLSAYGVSVLGSSNNNFSYNNVSDNLVGINLAVSSNNTVHDNYVSWNVLGAAVIVSSNDSVTSNDFYNNTLGFWLAGDNNTLSSNNHSFSAQAMLVSDARYNSVTDSFYNNTAAIHFDAAATENNVTGSSFENNSYHLEFNDSNNNYVINSNFSNHLVNQTYSDNAARNYLVNVSGLNASELEFNDSDSNVTIAYFVNVDVVDTAGTALNGATVTASNQSASLYSGTSPVRNAVMPVYLARQTSPLNYSPISFTASLSGYLSSTVNAEVSRDANVTITLQSPGGGSPASTPTCNDCDEDGVCRSCCDYDPDCSEASPSATASVSPATTPQATPAPTLAPTSAPSAPLAPSTSATKAPEAGKALEDANNAINAVLRELGSAQARGVDVSRARALVDQAVDARDAGRYGDAVAYAGQAMQELAAENEGLAGAGFDWSLAFVLAALALVVLGALAFKFLEKR